ncbi:hypothetical protein M0R72_12850 [Candidatus Pacearchaeota archaeon]|jgi:hypothetical protein|nr:hypothetical protein [Candidatus Pacearchaeota archaeon]
MNKKQKAEIDERSGGLCEAPNCPTPTSNRNYAHIEPKKMGGRKGKWKAIFDDPRNQVILCLNHHDIIDNRKKAPALREWLIRFLKKKVDHESWREENGLC